MKKFLRSTFYVSLTLVLVLPSCACNEGLSPSGWIEKEAKSFSIDKKEVLEKLKHFTRTSHVFGSPEQKERGEWLASESKKLGAQVHVQKFSAEVPNPILLKNPNAPSSLTLTKTGYNIVALPQSPQIPCMVLVGSHYDTKSLPNIDYLGVNDSGSSSILLLSLLSHTLKTERPECKIGYVWFDGEESTLHEWDDGLKRHPAKIQDNLYGSRHFVDQLESCTYAGLKAYCFLYEGKRIPIVSLILTDMIGNKNLKITNESSSSQELRTLLIQSLKSLNLENLLSDYPKEVKDDHIPFLDKGIKAIDIIDFENTDYWHNERDTIESISAESIENVGRISLFLGYSVADNPKAYL